MDKQFLIYERTTSDVVQCKVYKKRWFILITVIALNVCNSQIWCSYASVSNIAAQYYSVSVSKITIFSFVYFMCCFPGIFALWFTDYVGLNKAVWIGAWLNGIGATVRAISSTNFIEGNTKYNLAFVGQTTAALAPAFFNLPTKVSELWFPPNERSLATCMIAIAGSVGVMIGIGLEPVFVTKPEHIPMVNFVSCVFALVCVVMTFGFTSAMPPLPPSESAGEKRPPFRAAIHELLTNKSYLLLLLFEGAAYGISGVLVSLLEEILHPWGYSNKFAGLCVVLMVLFSIVGGFISAIILNRIKAFIPIAKISRSFGCILFPIFAVIIGYSGMEYPIAILGAILGITGILAHTSVLELTIECTFPLVPEALSTGILSIVSQTYATIYFLIMFLFSVEVYTEAGEGLDMRISVLVIAGLLVAFGISFILFFDTEYRRVRRETQSEINIIPEISLCKDNITSVKQITYGTVLL